MKKENKSKMSVNCSCSSLYKKNHVPSFTFKIKKKYRIYDYPTLRHDADAAYTLIVPFQMFTFQIY